MKQPTRWDSNSKRMGKRLTKRKKLSLLQRYEKEMGKGKNREQILAKIAQGIGVSSIRQVERILAQAKDFQEEFGRHFTQISTIALKLVQILEWYYNNHQLTIEPIISSDFPYTSHIDTPALKPDPRAPGARRTRRRRRWRTDPAQSRRGWYSSKIPVST